GAYVGERLGLGLGDLALRQRGAARHQVLHPGLGFGGNPLGLGLGAGDDCFRLAVGFAALALILAQQSCRFLAKPGGGVELSLDARRALVEPIEHQLGYSEIDQDADEDEESDRDPELGCGEEREHRCTYRFKAASTACSTTAPVGVVPISRSTIAAAASTAMPRTLAIAAVLVASMLRSASAILVLSSASSA